jgi:PAS domain S-box-containing protein
MDIAHPDRVPPGEARLAHIADLACRALGAQGAELAIGGRRATVGQAALADAAAAGVPVLLGDETIGTLSVLGAPGRTWSDDELALLGSVAATAGAEVELGRSGALLDSVLWNAPVALGFFDPQLRYMRVNAALAEVNGIPAEQHLGRTVDEMLPGIPAQVTADLGRVVRTGEPVVGAEVTGETPAQPGVMRHWVSSYYPIAGPDGGLFAIGAVVVEITERKRHERERAELLAAEQQARFGSERAAARLAALQSITAQLSGVSTLDDVADVLAGAVLNLLGLSAAALALTDDSGRLRLTRGVGTASGRKGLSVDARDPLGSVLLQRRLCVLSGSPSAVLPEDCSSSALIPLVVQGRAVGALALGWPAGAQAPEVAEHLFAALGDQFAQAIERAGLREAEQRARERLAFLAEASRVLSASLDAEATTRALARLAVAEVADACTVAVVTDRGLRLAGAAPFDDPSSDPTLTGPSGVDAALVADLDDPGIDPRHAELLRTLGLRSLMTAPLRAHGSDLGVLTLYQGPSGRRFSPDELAWMEDLAARVATALDNARLYRDRAHVARTLQRSLLPPADPGIPGLEVAARYHPVSEGSKVGGDFYDVFPLGRDAWGVVMGDVSGKGVAAASLTALSRYTVRAAALHLERPSAVLHTLNRAILDGDFEERFCTIVYMTVQEGDGSARVRLCRGGHPPPLLLAPDGTVTPVGDDGTAIGLLADPDLTDAEVLLGPGQALVLYTDGVLEARSADGVWGDDLVASVLSAAAGQPVERIAEALATAVLELADGSPGDDIAILVLRVPAEERVGPGLEEVLPPEPSAAQRARCMLSEWLDAGPRDDDVLLVATELIANAARVARNSVALRTWRTPTAVLIEVADDGEGFAPLAPRGQVPPEEAESGRGLFLVSALADDVQIRTTSTGTAVRCRLELNGS